MLISEFSGNETIFIVDDEPSIRRMIVQFLEKHGYTVLTAGNGIEALDVLSSYAGPVDALITDIIMPQMGGKELSELILPIYPKIKILFISGDTGIQFAQHCFLDPGVKVIPKPFTPTELIKEIRVLLDS